MDWIMSDSIELPSPPEGNGSLGRIVVLNRDLFFGVKIGNHLKSLGYDVLFAKETAGFAERVRGVPKPVLGLIDMNAGIDWDVVLSLTGESGPGVPVMAFGSHLDVEGRRAAKAAGVTRVLSNGDFHRDMVTLVKRYALTASDRL
jgi:hypothetical protein